ncbi:MAG: hypothetical protein IPM24_16315 [Bryobacterales bacterium]|nr:hypothetical protein [Bryobacterales bacterium]
MEPLSDRELQELLSRWDAPPAPPALENRIFGRTPQASWRRRLLTASIPVPVPVAVILILAVWAVWIYLPSGSRTESPGRQRVSFADFQPVEELRPQVIRSPYESN